ncbi:MAG: response regulator transcription factor [Clostridia bacterium]|nr:response regulator transcription factor [Clostridia bacterium]
MNTVKIAVCDDSSTDAGYICKLLSLWASRKNINLKTAIFPSAESFLFLHDEDKSYDILLLDIEMDKMNGITLAENIRKTDNDLKIVFITGYPEFVSRGYDVQALHYLIKPATEERLFPVLNRALAEIEARNNFVLFKTEKGSLRIDLKRIVFAEAFSHCIHITTLDGEFDVIQTLSQLIEDLGEDFVRCHRSYVVGLAHIGKLTKNELTLDNGKVIPVSRSSASEVHRAFVNYYTGDKLENI